MDLVDMAVAPVADTEDTVGLVAPAEAPAAPDLAAPARLWAAVCTIAPRWCIGPHPPDPRWVAAGTARPGTPAAAAACCLSLA